MIGQICELSLNNLSRSDRASAPSGEAAIAGGPPGEPFVLASSPPSVLPCRGLFAQPGSACPHIPGEEEVPS